MDKIKFLEQLEKVENLPTLPVVAKQIQKLIASPNSTMIQIAAIIAKDQAIAARVIRLINSAFYGLGGKVTSIQQAIVFLGLNTVKNLVMGVSVVKIFEESPSQASLFDRQKFWMHTFATALGAKLIAKKMNILELEDFFLAGLLHDIGILILDQFFHQEFIEIMLGAAKKQIDYTRAEQDFLGITHAEIGEFIARKWKLPEVLVHSILYHNKPLFTASEIAGDQKVISAVHIADVTAKNRGFDFGYRNGKITCDAQALKCIGLSDSEIETIFDSVEEDVKLVAKEWGV
jgi:putative nucleotidyltransferase with HDIG domain